ncbi:MAG: ABC transporter substrate-binding protein [Thermodesulfobacteriota bacterium]
MHHRYIGWLLLILIGFPVEPLASETIQITDFGGRTLRMKQPVERIVCLIESALSGIYMLDAQSRVVGVSTNVYEKPTVDAYARMDERIARKTLPAPGNWDFVSIEHVVALRPDLVVIWAHQNEVADALSSYGIPVYGVFIQSIEDVYKEIADLAALTDTRKRAIELEKMTRETLDGLQKQVQVPDAMRKNAYFIWPQGNLETSGFPSTVQRLMDHAGVRNAARSIQQEHAVIQLEQLLEWNPDLFVFWPRPKSVLPDFRADPAWARLKAVRNGAVHVLPDAFSCDLWTLKIVHAIRLVAWWAYPDRFPDFDPEQERIRTMKRLYGAKWVE